MMTISHQNNAPFPLAKMDLHQFPKGGLIDPDGCEVDRLIIDKATNMIRSRQVSRYSG
ncbi:hypothetical protein BJX61DRAFT_512782 [Aspergillus egyptiacus]|nr:hypothetical protein BJX61DRAFT_512782 [Aspergillus egyptiacus]